MNYSSAIHVSTVGQQPASTHPCVHGWTATNKHTITHTHTPMFPLLVSNQPAHTHVSIAGQQPASTHPCVHDWTATNKDTPMCPWSDSKQQTHTHTHTHQCLDCWSATNKHTPMSPLLLSTHPAHTHVSIADKHPPSTHPRFHF